MFGRAALLGLALSSAALAQTLPLSVQMSIQQAFDQATAAYDAGKWPEALTAYTELEQRLTKPGRSLAITRVRKGIVLRQLARNDDAQAALTTGLAQLPAPDKSLDLDRYQGNLALGQAQEALHQPLAALEAFAAAQQLAPDDLARISAIMGQARIDTFIDPAQALVLTDQAIILSKAVPDRNKRFAGQLHTIRGRALLNLGQFVKARSELNEAVTLLGGLTTRVGVSDLAARSDLAIAALLAGDSAAAKRYLAYSASGTLDQGFERGANMQLPDCGDTTGLRPDDVAVVEFSIADDGTVGYAMPVYVSRPGLASIEFARAVALWSWAPAPLAKIPPLLRSMNRVEVRCSLSSERPPVQALFDASVRTWFTAQQLDSVLPSGNAAADLVRIREGLRQRRAAGAGPLALAPWLFALDHNRAAPTADRVAAKSAWASAVSAAARPPMVRAAAGLALADASIKPSSHWSRDRALKVAAASLPLIDDAVIAADTRAADTLRLRLADDELDVRNYAAAKPLVQAVIADPRLPDGDPLHAAALLRASAIALAAGDLPGARTAFEQSGLSEAQCSLIDASPAVVRKAGGIADFPPEAITWHISGWSNTEFDINADGTTANVRATIAYPPFVFDKPTVKIFERTRYTASYRPGGGIGCTGFKATQAYRVIH